MDVRPVRIGARRARRRIRRRKQPPLQLGIIDLVRDRPAETRHGRPAHVLADRRLADPRRLADQPPAHPQRVRQTQRVTYLPHRHSLRWHRSLPGCQGARSADSTVDGSAALRRHHPLSAITGMLSALARNRCPRCTGFRSHGWRHLQCLVDTHPIVPNRDLARMQPIPSRAGYSKMAKTQVKETSATAFDEEARDQTSRIMGRKYDAARLAITDAGDDKPMPIVSHRGRSYSGFHSGAGELVSAELIGTQLPKTAIVLIDEIESSLHPRAQRRVIRDLAQMARLRDLQIIFTTHSPYILEELPPDGRLYVTDDTSGKTIIAGVSTSFAMTSMDDEQHPECDVYIEDEIAEDLLREIVVAKAPDILGRIRFIPYGPANVGRSLGQMDAEGRFPNKSCVFLDGDQEPSAGCNILPGGDAPERVLFDQLGSDWTDVAQRVGRSASKVSDACEKAMTHSSSRDWIDAAADTLLLKGSILWQAMCASWANRIMNSAEGVVIVDAIRVKLGSA